MTWICCGTAGWAGCSPGSGPRRRWARSLRTFTFGHVRQLDAVAASFLVNLTKTAPVLRDAATVSYLDIDDTIKATHGYTKQGASYGYSGVKELNALIATVHVMTRAPGCADS